MMAVTHVRAPVDRAASHKCAIGLSTISRQVMGLLALLLFLPCPAHAQDVATIKSLSARQPELEKILAGKKAVELLNGMTKASDSASPAEIEIINAENADRMALYAGMAGAMNTTPEGIGRLRAKKYLHLLKNGILRETTDATGATVVSDGTAGSASGSSRLPLRIVTLDGAEIHAEADPASTVVLSSIPRFSAYTVLDQKSVNGQMWFEVTTRHPSQKSGPPLGWISEDKALPWNHSIVAQPTTLFGRDPTILFETKDDLENIERLSSREDRREALAKRAADHEGISGVEPDVDFSTQKRAFVMPILDHTETRVESRPIMTLKLGAPTGGVAGTGLGKTPSIELVFVMDTTGSMSPYLAEVLKQVSDLAENLARTQPNIRFGFVGYQDYPEKDPHPSDDPAKRLQYPAKIFTESLLPIVEFAAQLRNVKAVAAPTDDDIPEAVYEGIEAALDANFWSDNAIKLVTLIGDAPASIPSKLDSIDEHSLRLKAKEKGIYANAIFLKSGASSTDETDRLAIRQLREFTRSNINGIERGSTAPSYLKVVDAREMTKFSSSLAMAIDSMQSFLKDPKAYLAARDGKTDGPTGHAATAPQLDFDVLLSNAYIDWVAKDNVNEPPKVVEGWTTDWQLSNPSRRALVPKVMLTRVELGNLARLVQEILNTGEENGEDLFPRLQSSAATTLVDPSALMLKDRFQMPAGIDRLPYRSQILTITEEQWKAMAGAEQKFFFDELRRKLRWYETLLKSNQAWKPLALDTPDESKVCLLDLDMLP